MVTPKIGLPVILLNDMLTSWLLRPNKLKKSSQIYFTTMQNEKRYKWKTAKDLTSSRFTAPSINILKRFDLSGISVEVIKIQKKSRNACGPNAERTN